jgi:CheY-like chemotaxis protein/anti-sigma regulatory factor (Ser/Thr protein kinase)
MSHEIRTPLNGMLGVAQLLGLSQLDDKQRRYVETLQASGRVLTGVIEEILDISRIEAGKLHLSPEAVDTADWLDETLNPFQATAGQKGLALTWVIEGGARSIRRFDPRRMAQVVGNLVSNAVKFTETGQVSVAVSASTVDRLRVQVTDTGPGIPDDEQTAIFERFTQSDMSPSRPHGGTGLGLAIARELTKLAGGEIGVVSKLGEGATFWFEIPAERAAAASEQETADTARPGLEGLRALIVEDNAINRDTLMDMLRQHAVTTEAVDCGEAALDRLAEAPFDLVLLDLHMPGIGGCETLRKIRRGDAGRKEIPVFLVTADATPSARDWANALGADGFFTKPVEMSSLVDTLAELAQTKDRV